MSAPADRPLSALDSLRGLLAAFRLLEDELGIDLDATTIRVTAAGWVSGGGQELAVVTLRRLLAGADAVIAADRLAQANRDVPGAHSPLPWTVGDDPAEPLALHDALGTPIFAPPAWQYVPTNEAVANVALVARAVSAFPLLIAALNASIEALRAYERGEAGPEQARAAADACAVVVAQVEGR